MASSHTLDRLDSCFDDTHAVANAGLLLAATLAERLGIDQAADALIDLGERAGAHRPGRKLLTLVHAMLAGGLRRAPRGAMQPGGLQEPTSGLSQQAGEAGGSLTPEAQGRAGAAPTTTGRAGTARQPGPGKQGGKV